MSVFKMSQLKVLTWQTLMDVTYKTRTLWGSQHLLRK